MVPILENTLPQTPKRQPKSLDLLQLSRKNPCHPRTWLILTVLFLQILLIFTVRSLPHHSHSSRSDAARCPNGKIYVYSLPPEFNSDLLRNCHELNPWSSSCRTFSNGGFGPEASALSGHVPDSLSGTWHWTDQFALEIIYHNRITHHKCLTADPASATAFYIPFYAGLAVGKYLWASYGPQDRDQHCLAVLAWLRSQPSWKNSDGWDHFISMGRITWDFRRARDGAWGSQCIFLPEMKNVTRLLIERNPWDYFDVGVPYPTGFHPRNARDLATWQDFVRRHERPTLFCFAGATRGFIKDDFRGRLLNQCRNESSQSGRRGACRVVDCDRSRCANGTSEILSSFLRSDFCLQPRGDSFTRRSIFDCMVAGSIPVFFWKRTAYFQYEWFLPGDPGSYSVFLDRNAVKKGMSIRNELEKIGKEKVRAMREKVIEYIPKIVYAKPNEGLVGVKDAFDVAIDGVLKRINTHKGRSKWW